MVTDRPHDRPHSRTTVLVTIVGVGLPAVFALGGAVAPGLGWLAYPASLDETTARLFVGAVGIVLALGAAGFLMRRRGAWWIVAAWCLWSAGEIVYHAVAGPAGLVLRVPQLFAAALLVPLWRWRPFLRDEPRRARA